jgi:DnaJ-class molecular chaperone
MTDIRDRALRDLGIELPVMATALKTAYRAAAKRTHSDVGGSDEAFKRVNATYQAVIQSNLVLSDNGSVANAALRTIDGILLSELGLGLGPLVNGRDCDECARKGYREQLDLEFTACNTCAGTGIARPCRACQATGQFTQRYGRKVTCRACAGLGYLPGSLRNAWSMFGRLDAYCPKCIGTGRMGKPNPRTLYYKCGACEGKGEIKIYNPVILKGSMSQAQRKRQQK